MISRQGVGDSLSLECPEHVQVVGHVVAQRLRCTPDGEGISDNIIIRMGRAFG